MCVVYRYIYYRIWIGKTMDRIHSNHLFYSQNHFYWQSLRFPSTFWFMNFTNILYKWNKKSSKSILHISNDKNQTKHRIERVLFVSQWLHTIVYNITEYNSALCVFTLIIFLFYWAIPSYTRNKLFDIQFECIMLYVSQSHLSKYFYI